MSKFSLWLTYSTCRNAKRKTQQKNQCLSTTQHNIIRITFPLQQRSRERTSLLRYTYIVCLVVCWNYASHGKMKHSERRSGVEFSFLLCLSSMGFRSYVAFGYVHGEKNCKNPRMIVALSVCLSLSTKSNPVERVSMDHFNYQPANALT